MAFFARYFFTVFPYSSPLSPVSERLEKGTPFKFWDLKIFWFRRVRICPPKCALKILPVFQAYSASRFSFGVSPGARGFASRARDPQAEPARRAIPGSVRFTLSEQACHNDFCFVLDLRISENEPPLNTPHLGGHLCYVDPSHMKAALQLHISGHLS